MYDISFIGQFDLYDVFMNTYFYYYFFFNYTYNIFILVAFNNT